MNRNEQEDWIHPLKHCSHAFGAIPVCKRLGKQKNPGKRMERVMQPFYQSSRVLAVAKLHSSSSSSSVLFLLLRTCLLEPQLKTRNLLRSTSSHSCIQRTHRLPLVLEALCCKSTSLCALADLTTCQNARESGQSMTFHPCKTAEISGFSSRSLHVWTKSSNSPAET